MAVKETASARGGSKKEKKAEEKAEVKDDDPDLKDTSKFDAIEKEVTRMVDDIDQLKAFWAKLDFNGNGKVSLAEIDKAVVEKWEILNHKPALMRAYKRTTSKDGGGDGDSWVEKKELKNLLRNLLFYNKLFYVFDEVDTGDDRRVDLAEFQKSSSKLGLR